MALLIIETNMAVIWRVSSIKAVILSCDTISASTSNSSQYALDAGNFTSGYDNNNKITVYVIYTNLEAETTLTISENIGNLIF